MKYDRTCSASGMFVSNNVTSFNERWRKNIICSILKNMSQKVMSFILLWFANTEMLAK